MLHLFGIMILIGTAVAVECTVVPVPRAQRALPAKPLIRKPPVKPAQKNGAPPVKRPIAAQQPNQRANAGPVSIATPTIPANPEPMSILTPTINHGDLQCHNVMFDELGGHYTYIDLETITWSLNSPLDPRIDFETMFNYNVYPYAVRNNDPAERIKLLLENTVKPFVEGYVSVFNPADQKKVLLELREMFLRQPIHIKEPTGPKLQKIQQQLKPIFDDLLKKYTGK